MEANALFAILVHDVLDQALFMSWQGRIHETRHGATNQLNACPNNVKSHCNCDQRIKKTPTCQSCDSDAADHTDRSPYISHEMMRICLESNRTAISTLA